LPGEELGMGPFDALDEMFSRRFGQPLREYGNQLDTGVAIESFRSVENIIECSCCGYGFALRK